MSSKRYLQCDEDVGIVASQYEDYSGFFAPFLTAITESYAERFDLKLVRQFR